MARDEDGAMRVLRLCGFSFLFASALAGGQPQPDDFALRLEAAAGAAPTITVVGSWKIGDIQGWSWGVCHDPAEASIGDCAGVFSDEKACEDCPAVECPPDMLAPGPDDAPVGYHSIVIRANGVTQGVILDLGASWTLPAQDRFELLRVTYRLQGPALRLFVCDTLGDPPLRTVFVVGGKSYPPATRVGIVLETSGFLRGNVNGDAGRNIADAVYVLGYLFARGKPPPCMDAADANDDGTLNVADAISVLAHLFSRGAIPEPFASCGSDPTEDTLGCEWFAPCGKVVEG